MRKIYYFGLFLAVSAFGQETKIDTIVIDSQLLKTAEISVIQHLTAKDVIKNASSLSDILRFQTPIYIKETSRGAVSSPSFRGTTALQTAFVWNGININSQFLAQGDVNNIPIFGYDQIDVKSGGGSVLYGSGAIGGSIHLNNELTYNKGFNANIFGEYASFNTINSYVKSTFSNDKISLNISGSHAQSDNDYEVPEKYYVNRNAKYDNTSVNLGLGYKLSEAHQLYLQSQHFDSNQNYVSLSENSDKTKYEAQTFRSLIGWKWNKERFKNDFKLAYLEDNFQYFDNVNQPKSSGGSSKQYLIKNDAVFNLNANSEINIIGELSKVDGDGYQSGIDKVARNQAAFALLYRNRSVDKLYWEIGVKKEFVEAIEAPFLFSAGASYLVKSWYKTSVNLSKNFRYPSFNDLYWQPGGNLDLKPETSYQAELSQNFKIKNVAITLTPYLIKIYDLIQWVPMTNNIWSPVNTKDVLSYGLESQIKFSKKWTNQQLLAQANYSYTKSVNQETKKQLMYVPLHKANLGIDYNYKAFSIFAQAIFTSRVFSDNNENTSASFMIDANFVANVGAYYQLTKNIKIGAKVNNLTNQSYETVKAYWMPLRNYSGQILIKL